MPIKNGRYRDSKGNVRHLETNENMVIVDGGLKTLKQKLTEMVASIQELVSSKVDALFVKDITGDKAQLQTVDKTNLVNAINELKRTGGSGGATLNVFKRTGGTWGVFTATQATTTFDVAGFNGTEKCLDVYYKGLPLIPEKDFNVSQTGTVTLGFELAINESVDYCVSDVSFNYDDLANKPNLDLKANKDYVDNLMNGTVSIKPLPPTADQTKLWTWNKNGVYLTPTSGVVDLPTGWVQGRHMVVVFEPNNADYGGQIIMPYEGSTGGNKKIAFRNSIRETSQWKELATTDMTTVLDNKIGVLNQEHKMKTYRRYSDLGLIAKWDSIEACVASMPNDSVCVLDVQTNFNNYSNFFPTNSGVVTITKQNANRCYLLLTSSVVSVATSKVWYSWYREVETVKYSWQEMATTSKINILTNTLANGWTAKYGDIILNATGNQVVITGTLSCGTLTDGTLVMTVPPEYKPTTRTSHCTIGTFKGDEQGTFTVYTDGTIKYRGGSITGATDVSFCFTYILY